MLANQLGEPLPVVIGVWEDNSEADSVVYEFLEKLAREARVEVEEFGAQVMLGENEPSGAQAGAYSVRNGGAGSDRDAGTRGDNKSVFLAHRFLSYESTA